MANLLKEAKRGKHLPRVINGSISTGVKVDWQPADDSGMRKARGVFHTLDIGVYSGADRVEYQLQVSDDEMIRITSEWLTEYHQRRKRDVQSKS